MGRSVRTQTEQQRRDLGVDVRDFLDRAALARDAVPRRDDAPVRALPELLDELVLGVDDEDGVERGELVSLHYLFSVVSVDVRSGLFSQFDDFFGCV